MRFLRRSLTGLFLAALTLGLLALAGLNMVQAFRATTGGDRPARQAEERVFAARVLTLTSARATPVFQSFGEVRSRRTLELRAPSSGTVIELAPGFEDGARVTAGQLLLRIDPAEAQTALDVARNGMTEAQAERADAIRALDLAAEDVAAAQAQAGLRNQALARQNNLSARGVGSEAAIETAALAASAADQSVLSRRQGLAQAQARAAQAETGLARAEIALHQAQRQLDNTELRAEFAGTLGDVTVVEGGLVGASEKVAQIIDPDALEVSFRVSTTQYSQLLDAAGALPAAVARVSLDGSGADVGADTGTEARLSRVGAVVGEGQSGRLIYATLTDARGLRPGDFVTVRVDEPPMDGVAVLPATAIDAAGAVLVLGAGDRLDAANVEVLRRQGDVVLVRAPALEGREFVAERSPLLGPGIKVRPVRDDAAVPGTAASGLAGTDARSAGAAADAGDTPTRDAPTGDAPTGDTPTGDAPSGDAIARPTPDGATTVGDVALTDARRAELIAFVQSSTAMPAAARDRVLAQLARPTVPASLLARLEQRMGG